MNWRIYHVVSVLNLLWVILVTLPSSPASSSTSQDSSSDDSRYDNVSQAFQMCGAGGREPNVNLQNTTTRVCDPCHQITTLETLWSMENAAIAFEQAQDNPYNQTTERRRKRECGSADDVTVRMPPLAIALVAFDLQENGSGGKDDSLSTPAAARKYASLILDNWGRGTQSTAAIDCKSRNGSSLGQSGASQWLLLVSVPHRQAYLFESSGNISDSLLLDPGDHLQSTVSRAMKPYLMDRKFDKAVQAAVQVLIDWQRRMDSDDVYLSGDDYHLGDDSEDAQRRVWSKLLGTCLISTVAILFLCCTSHCCFGCCSCCPENSRLATATASTQRCVHRHCCLKWDLRRAQSLQGKYNATSCPICLEDFDSRTPQPAEERKPLLMLSFPRRKPKAPPPRFMVGSDGLAPRLLPCGHMFDETCWQSWCASCHPQSTVSCPVCRCIVNLDLIDATTKQEQPQLPPRRSPRRSEEAERDDDEDHDAGSLVEQQQQPAEEHANLRQEEAEEPGEEHHWLLGGTRRARHSRGDLRYQQQRRLVRDFLQWPPPPPDPPGAPPPLQHVITFQQQLQQQPLEEEEEAARAPQLWDTVDWRRVVPPAYGSTGRTLMATTHRHPIRRDSLSYSEETSTAEENSDTEHLDDVDAV